MPNKILPRLLALSLMALAALPARGADEIGNNWLKVIQALEARGVKQVGNFSVRAFKGKAAGISWHSMDQAPPSVLAGSRQSAVYFRAQRKIYVNTSTFGSAERISLPQLELHELLGATGFDDSSYQSSSALLEISEAGSAGEAARLAKLYGSSVFNAGAIMARNAPRDVPAAFRGEDGGSGTSIGGGGDLPTIHIKAEVLRLVKTRGQLSNEFRLAYPNIAFEPVVDRSVREVVLEYTYTRVKSAKGYREKFSVFVPMCRWEAGAAAQRDLIEDIATKVTGLFPAYGGGGQITTIVPPGCPSSVRVSFPFSPDRAVQLIQRERAEATSRCDDMNANQRSVTSGGITADQLPRKNGIFNFVCTFEHASLSQPEERKTSSVLGRGMITSLGVGWRGADYLAGNVSIGPKGELRGVSISYVANGVRQNPGLTPAQSPSQASTQMIIDGSPLRFTCTAN